MHQAGAQPVQRPRGGTVLCYWRSSKDLAGAVSEREGIRICGGGILAPQTLWGPESTITHRVRVSELGRDHPVVWGCQQLPRKA